MSEEESGVLTKIGVVLGGGIGIIGYIPLLICLALLLLAGVGIIGGSLLGGSSYFAFYIDESEDTIEGVRGLLWALLNTKEFIVNH